VPDYSDSRLLVPGAAQAIDRLKYEVANEIAYTGAAGTRKLNVNPSNYAQQIDNLKYEVAGELGILDEIRRRGWADMPSREMGRIGGRIGGPIGGQMVRRMIMIAEQQIAQGAGLPQP
jgi:hypothetical protein